MKKIFIIALATMAGVFFGVALSTQLLVTGALNKNYRAYIVQSGSMEPALKVGSIVFTQSSKQYNPGDIITFPVGESLVTHRIASIKKENGEVLFQTKGDANEEADSALVAQSKVVGRSFLTIPYFGYFADFVRTPKGFVIFVVIPASIIIYEELKAVFKEIKKFLFKKGDENKTPQRAALLLPVVGVAFLFLSNSSSFFSDQEASLTNILGAAESFSTPTSTPISTPTSTTAVTLVINEVLPDSSCEQGNTEAQWLEVYNGYPNSVNLKNFKITDGTNTIDLVTANNINIASGAFALLAHNSAIWNNCYSDNGVITANLGGQLDIDTGALQLLDSESNIIDTVKWGGANVNQPIQNESVERDPNGKDTATGINFSDSDFVIQTTPQPGL